jgi:hypothetical protein
MREQTRHRETISDLLQLAMGLLEKSTSAALESMLNTRVLALVALQHPICATPRRAAKLLYEQSTRTEKMMPTKSVRTWSNQKKSLSNFA